MKNNNKLLSCCPSLDSNAIKLERAVYRLFAAYGHTSLTKEKIIATSGVRENELDRHFGNIAMLKDYCLKRILEVGEDNGVIVPFRLKPNEIFNSKSVTDYLDGLISGIYHDLLLQKVLVLSYHEESRVLDCVRERWKALFDELLMHSREHFKGTGIDFKTSFMQAIGGVLYLFQLEDKNDLENGAFDKTTRDQLFTAINNVHLVIKPLFKKASDLKKRNTGHS
ncbi:MAG: hypothetical protein ACN6O7_09860 [Sphingobacterium sp.]